jgi:hypothetical protein
MIELLFDKNEPFILYKCTHHSSQIIIMYMLFAFRFDRFLVIDDRTLIHCKIMFDIHCTSGTSTPCRYCPYSQRERYHTMHYIVYSADLSQDWHFEVDCKRFEKRDWTFLRIPMVDAQRAHTLVQQQLGKPFNSKGYYLNHIFGQSYGLESTTPPIDFRSRTSWMCTELACAVIADQPGYDRYVRQLVPCRVFPIELWHACRRIPGVVAFGMAPWNVTAPEILDQGETRYQTPPDKPYNDDGSNWIRRS